MRKAIIWLLRRCFSRRTSVRYFPLPGTATEQDVIDIESRENRLCELVDGVLVEKPLAYMGSYVAGQILTKLNNFVEPGRLAKSRVKAG